jgi:uncharacterized protein DUF1648
MWTNVEWWPSCSVPTLISQQLSLRMAKEQFGAEHLMLGSDYPLGSGSLRDAGIGFTDWFAHACSPVPERSASLMLAKSACANATCARTRASNLLEPVLQWSIVGAMFVAAAIVWPLAPDSLPVHFRINGEANRYGSKVEGLLILPLVIPIANRTPRLSDVLHLTCPRQSSRGRGRRTGACAAY